MAERSADKMFKTDKNDPRAIPAGTQKRSQSNLNHPLITEKVPSFCSECHVIIAIVVGANFRASLLLMMASIGLGTAKNALNDSLRR